VSEERQRPAPPPLPERLVSLAVELAGLALMWRALDGPDPRDLLEDALAWARRQLDARDELRRSFERAAESIRNLPETEGAEHAEHD
jgi:hypothetical protein